MFIGLCLDYFGVKLEWTTHQFSCPPSLPESITMCSTCAHAYIHYCSYNYLISILFVYMMYTIVAVCVCVCECVCVCVCVCVCTFITYNLTYHSAD